jgi:hypothetical protein
MLSLISWFDIKGVSHRLFVQLLACPGFYRHSHPVVYKSRGVLQGRIMFRWLYQEQSIQIIQVPAYSF